MHELPCHGVSMEFNYNFNPTGNGQKVLPEFALYSILDLKEE